MRPQHTGNVSDTPSKEIIFGLELQSFAKGN
jgi:hypothetical protein